MRKFISGYRPVVRAREGRMLGMRQPLDGPIFEKLEDARNCCIHAMISHFDRRLGMSDARIEAVPGPGGLRPATIAGLTFSVFAKKWSRREAEH